ncbi:hypothetical protein ANANG_G00225810 [Anguilla anguilla]|uniref:Mig-6 domain-containing protein n=1 Tax=Anguilla anguilla TaxID=7936 RepID=A0A9D3RQK8_ANGAN|nr:hypothetical protein ANANG_G00225810 [Anguilla anguilla]
MRPNSSWIMSTAGLRAREIPEALKSAFSHGLTMATTKPFWEQHHDLNNLYFSLDAPTMDYNLKAQQQVPVSAGFERQVSQPHSMHSPGAQRLPPKKSRPSQLILSACTESCMPGSPEGDQVVPSFQRLSVYERTPPQTPSRSTKPLPPLPGSADLSSDEAVDNEVEFFTTSADESQRLVREPCPKPLAFRYGTPSRRSFRGCGQINYAYFEGPIVREQQQQQQQQPQQPQQPPLEHSEVQQTPHRGGQQKEPTPRDCPRQLDRPQRKLRRSHSGPAGSFNKPSVLRLSCHHHGAHSQDKPEVPPRVPIPPRPLKAADYRRWSAEVTSGGYSDEDRPPKSFAPNPKYVSRGLQRQNSEGSPTTRTPCILPIIENGKKASTTHYFLLPQRPVYLDKFERYFREADCESGDSCPPSTDWDCQTKHKPHVHLV